MLKKAYSLLNVRPSSSISEIKSAYRKAASRYHPDSLSGEADVEKFHQVVNAYNLVMDHHSEVEAPPRKGWIFRMLTTSKERVLKLVKGRKDKQGREWKESFTRQGYWSTFNLLVRKLDHSGEEEERIKAARTLYRLYRAAFTQVAVPRLEACEGKLLRELIKMTASAGEREGLEAIAGYIYSEDFEIMMTAYVSLECAGEKGHAVVARALGVHESFFDKLADFASFGGGSDAEEQVPPSQYRRMATFSRYSGAPMSLIREQMGFPETRPA